MVDARLIDTYVRRLRRKLGENSHHPGLIKTVPGVGYMIREADRLMAEAIRVVAALYQDGVLAKPKTYTSGFPDLLTFHDAPTPSP